VRGILGWGVYVPHRRLDRKLISPVAGQGGGSGTRSVASYDEDTTTMAVEAGRAALRGRDSNPRSLWFATAAPTYLDRTNANVVHAALRLDRNAAAYDALGSTRGALGALRAGLDSPQSSLVVASDLRVGYPGGPEETVGGDAAAALLVGSDTDGPVLAEVVAWESLSQEFVDRWRVPGEPVSKLWEERFGETVYTALGLEAFKLLLESANLAVEDVDLLVVTGLAERAVASVAASCGVANERVLDRRTSTIGNPGAAQPALLLAAALESARPGQTIVLLSLADGVDAVALRTTDALTDYVAARTEVSVAAQAAGGAPITYGRYLAWRGMLPVEPPRRPEPARVSSSAAYRNASWKYGFEAGGERNDPHLPPKPTDATSTPMSHAVGTIVTFTVDKLSYSQSPPTIFAVVDFDGGGRLPVELTDADVDQIAIGGRVELTFRRLNTGDGIANYFWKARPVRSGAVQGGVV
jgi:3-hydroxy-3-methylglutaryl CoA synthase